jgi:hypothetical protein
MSLLRALEPTVVAYCEKRGCGKQLQRDDHGLLNISAALSRDQQTEAAIFSLANLLICLLHGHQPSRPLLLLQANTTQCAVIAHRLLHQRQHNVAN